MTISALPIAPSRSDAPATFIARADAFVAALATFRTDVNAYGDELKALADNVAAGAGQIATSTTNITLGAGTVTLTVTEEGIDFGLGQFVSVARSAAPTSQNFVGQVSSWNPASNQLQVNVSAGDLVGSGTYSGWTIVAVGKPGSGRRLPYSARTAN